MVVVEIIKGEYEGFAGILEGYVGSKGKITVPIAGEPDVSLMLDIRDFEIAKI